MKLNISRKKLFIIIPIVIVAIFIFTRGSGNDALYDTSPVEQATLRSEVSVTGKVNPVKAVDLSFEQTGTIAYIAGEVGDQVVAGQTIASLDTSALLTQLHEAEASLATAEAALAAINRGTRPEELTVLEQKVNNAQTSLTDAQQAVRDKIRDAYTRVDDAIHSNADDLFSNPNTVQPTLKYTTSDQQLARDLENTRVEIGSALTEWSSVIAQLQNADVAALENYTVQSQAWLAKTASFLDKLAQAISQFPYTNTISQTTLTTYTTNISAARTSVNTAITNLTTAKEKMSTASGSLSLAQKELALSKAGATQEDIDEQNARVANARATVSKMNTQLAKATLRSPFSGVITSLPLEKGAVVTPSSVVATVVTANALEIVAYIPEVDIADVVAGKTARITLDAYGDTTAFEAVVTKVDPAETTLDGVPTYKTTLTFTSPDSRVKPGMTANIEILIDEHADVLAVPTRAISFDENGSPTVKILTANGSEETRSVTTGLRSFDGRTEIIDGVSKGEKIILSTR